MACATTETAEIPALYQWAERVQYTEQVDNANPVLLIHKVQLMVCQVQDRAAFQLEKRSIEQLEDAEQAQKLKDKLDFLRSVYKPYGFIRVFFEDMDLTVKRRQQEAQEQERLRAKAENDAEHEKLVAEGLSDVAVPRSALINEQASYQLPSAEVYQAAVAAELHEETKARTSALLDQLKVDTDDSTEPLSVDESIAETKAVVPRAEGKPDNVWIEILTDRIFQFDMRTTQWLPCPLNSDMAMKLLSQEEFGVKIAQQAQILALYCFTMPTPPMALVLGNLPRHRQVVDPINHSLDIYAGYERYIVFFRSIRPNNAEDKSTLFFMAFLDTLLNKYHRTVQMAGQAFLTAREKCSAEQFELSIMQYSVSMIHAQEALLMEICRIGLYDTVKDQFKHWFAPTYAIPNSMCSQRYLVETEEVIYSYANSYKLWNRSASAPEGTELPPPEEGFIPKPASETQLELKQRYLQSLYEYTGGKHFAQSIDNLYVRAPAAEAAASPVAEAAASPVAASPVIDY